jgi:Uma2 family endonuclease
MTLQYDHSIISQTLSPELLALRPQGTWTYDAYAALPDDGQRYEIVHGVLMVKEPAPTTTHERISIALSSYLFMNLNLQGRGEVFHAPVDVELSPKNVFQPDVMVLLNDHLDRILEKRIYGAPDMVVEVISPSSKKIDQVLKYEAYQEARIPEYWIIDPKARTIEVFVLENDIYNSLGKFAGEQIVPSRIVPDLGLPVSSFIRYSYS